jgi:hypothetical protein
MAKIKWTVCPVSVNHGTVGGVKTEYRVNGMVVIRGDIYLFVFMYLFIIYLFIHLFIYELYVYSY